MLIKIGMPTDYFYNSKVVPSIPCIDDYYSRCQKIIFNNLKSCIVAEDRQMDSPGFCAKQCVYTFMDAINYYVLHIENVDIKEAQLKSCDGKNWLFTSFALSDGAHHYH